MPIRSFFEDIKALLGLQSSINPEPVLSHFFLHSHAQVTILLIFDYKYNICCAPIKTIVGYSSYPKPPATLVVYDRGPKGRSVPGPSSLPPPRLGTPAAAQQFSQSLSDPHDNGNFEHSFLPQSLPVALSI